MSSWPGMTMSSRKPEALKELALLQGLRQRLTAIPWTGAPLESSRVVLYDRIMDEIERLEGDGAAG